METWACNAACSLRFIFRHLARIPAFPAAALGFSCCCRRPSPQQLVTDVLLPPYPPLPTPPAAYCLEAYREIGCFADKSGADRVKTNMVASTSMTVEVGGCFPF